MKILLIILLFVSTNVYSQAITALTEDTSPTSDDLTVTVNNPATTPATRKVTLANMKTFMLNGNSATATSLAANGTNCSAGNYPLGVDASGNAESCTAVSSGTPSGNSTNVQYNSSGSFAGSDNFVFDGTNVGIGTASASSQLHLTKISANSTFNIDTRSATASHNSAITLSRSSATNGNLSLNDEVGSINFNSLSNGSAVDTARISSQYVGSGTTRLGQLQFLTSNGSNPVNRMMIQNDGNIGIGFTSGTPAAALEIKKGANPLGTSLRITNSSSGDYLSVIDGGNVGISTANPRSLLEVNGNIMGDNGGIVNHKTFGITIDGGGSAITTGVKGYLPIPFTCVINNWNIVADTSGSIVIDVWKDTYANFPPTVADTIAGSEKPTLSSAQKNQDTSLSTWTTTVTSGDVLGFNVDSATTVTKATVVIRCDN